MKLWKFLVPIFSSISVAFAASILAIAQNPSFSHEYLHYKLLKELAVRGHQLTIFSTREFDYEGNRNVTQHIFAQSTEIFERKPNMSYVELRKKHWIQLLLNIELNAFYDKSSSEILHPHMQELIHNSHNHHFDVIILECYFCYFSILADIYDCPIVSFMAADAPTGMHEIIGNDVHPGIYPDTTRFPYLHGQLTFSQRITSAIYYINFHLLYCSIFYPFYARRLERDHPTGQKKSFQEIFNERLALMIVNTDPDFGYVRPLMPNTIQVGFYHVDEAKELPVDSDVKKYLDSSTNGVIIVCFGSIIKSNDLGHEIIDKFLSAFNASSDYNFLWKFDEDVEEARRPKNVKMTKWLPLSDALAHPNVKAVIHHGGLLTCYEAIAREVPQIVFPIIYDGPFNARLVAEHEVGIELEVTDFKVDELVTAIKEVVGTSYKLKVKELKERIYDRPIDRKELTVWHIENVIRHKSEMKFERDPYKMFFVRHFLDLIGSGIFMIAVTRIVLKKFIKT